MNDKASRNKREGTYGGRYRGVHFRGFLGAQKVFRLSRKDRKAEQRTMKHYDYHDGEPA